MLTYLSLFSGIGGLDLAAEMAGFKTVGQCEWADYPTKVLEKHWPDVPRWRDIRTLTGDSFYERTGLQTVDVISGGFPCQPFSVAGKRRGKEDDRYLWPEMLRVIQEIRPTWVVGENVAGIVNLALDQVLSDLESINYACQPFIIPACSVNAAHRRDRCAIVAWNANGRNWIKRKKPKMEKRKNSESARICKNVSDSNFNRLQKCRRETRTFAIKNWRPIESGLGRVVDGVPSWMDRYWVEEPDIPRITTQKKNRADRLKCLGNAVYWRQFYQIFDSIAKIYNSSPQEAAGERLGR